MHPGRERGVSGLLCRPSYTRNRTLNRNPGLFNPNRKNPPGLPGEGFWSPSAPHIPQNRPAFLSRQIAWGGQLSCTLECLLTMQTKYPVGILGATGMVGQRFIQLLEHHPWFEVAWVAASERSEGRTYAEAAKWRMRTPMPANVARMTVAPAATPEGAPRVIFAALDSGIAAELEPRYAQAGHVVITNSSALRMKADVPLVIPEVNADHVKLIETQPTRKQNGGYVVTNPNCSAIGLVVALAPIHREFGLEKVF